MDPVPKTTSGRETTRTCSDDIAARAAACDVLADVLRKRRRANDSFGAAAKSLEPRDRAFVRMLVSTTLRRLGQVDAVLDVFLAKWPADQIVDVLRLGTAQLLFLDTPPHAAVVPPSHWPNVIINTSAGW